MKWGYDRCQVFVHFCYLLHKSRLNETASKQSVLRPTNSGQDLGLFHYCRTRL